VDTWAELWKQVSCLPNFQRDLANRVFVDVMNEPDSMNIRWEARDGRPGAQQLYLGTADALWALTPNKVLFMFEGAGFASAGMVELHTCSVAMAYTCRTRALHEDTVDALFVQL
jgi:hypothetical protein